MSGNGDQNLFDLSENAVNQLKKPELVKKILGLKGRVTVNKDICGLCDQIKNLIETVYELLDKHEQLNSELLVCKSVNKHLEEKVAKLEKAQAISEQYSWRNNIDLAGIPNSIRDSLKLNNWYDTTFNCIYTIIQVVHTEFTKVVLTVYSVFQKFKQNDSRTSCTSSNYCTNFQEKQVKEKETKKKVCVKPWLKRRKKFGFYETLLAERQLEVEYN